MCPPLTEGWLASFYLKGVKPAEFLTYCASKFSTVELDNTLYSIPPLSIVEGWNMKMPARLYLLR